MCIRDSQILLGVVEAVYVIDSQPGDPAVPGQSKEQAVTCLKNLGVFHPQTDEVIDAEEAPIVDHVLGHPPVGQTICLKVQQIVQEIETVRVLSAAVEESEVVIEKLPDHLIVPIQDPEIFFENLLLSVSFPEFALAGDGAGR
jgi:hypothetical protein